MATIDELSDQIIKKIEVLPELQKRGHVARLMCRLQTLNYVSDHDQRLEILGIMAIDIANNNKIEIDQRIGGMVEICRNVGHDDWAESLINNTHHIKLNGSWLNTANWKGPHTGNVLKVSPELLKCYSGLLLAFNT